MHSWAAVEELARSRKALANPSSEPKTRILDAAGLRLDYSRASINDEILEALFVLADKCGLRERFASMAAGEKVNATEGRSVGHMRLRDPQASEEVRDEMERMLIFAGLLGQGEVVGSTGKPIRSILHIGIGGSYLGPRLVCESLPNKGPTCRFVANVDPAAMADATAELDPETTLVVSVSKSGTTTETLENTRLAMEWIDTSCGIGAGIRQLSVVSSNPEAAPRLGCPPERSFAMWDWVGGRYSFWSPVGMSAAACVGPEAFRQLLDGAHSADLHALGNEPSENMAITLALLRAWHSLALGAQTHCVVAYQHRLRSLPAYLQQLVMESNGKSITVTGARPGRDTSAIWWGGEGSNDQHSYFQLLLQGMRSVPSDFVFARRPREGEDEGMHRQLIAHCIGQGMALHRGRDRQASLTSLDESGISEDRAAELAGHLVVPGGQPTNLISFDRLDPSTLGALVATYEHMTAALGWLWEVNSFDQWGVELGKSNFRKVLRAIEGKGSAGLDSAAKDAVAGLGS